MNTVELKLFDNYTHVCNKQDPTDIRFIIKYEHDKSRYLCDGSSIPLSRHFEFKEIKTKHDLVISAHIRLHADLNCYSITEFLPNNKVRIHQIHGDNYYLEVDIKELLDKNYHPFNLK